MPDRFFDRCSFAGRYPRRRYHDRGVAKIRNPQAVEGGRFCRPKSPEAGRQGRTPRPAEAEAENQGENYFGNPESGSEIQQYGTTEIPAGHRRGGLRGPAHAGSAGNAGGQDATRRGHADGWWRKGHDAAPPSAGRADAAGGRANPPQGPLRPGLPYGTAGRSVSRGVASFQDFAILDAVLGG